MSRPVFVPVVDPARVALWLLLGVITMLFAAFASAYLVRMSATDWTTLALPPILRLNTAILVLSSVALELGRRRAALSRRQWTGAAIVLGLCFAVGQVLSWQQLQAAGILVPTTPHSTFLYILTGLHLTHLVGGGAFLVSSWLGLLVNGGRPARHRHLGRRLDLSVTYWHFMGGLWIFLYAFLHLG